MPMKQSKKLLAATAIVLGLGAAGTGVTVFAAQGYEGQLHPLVEAIAERFNLDPIEVQEVFEENRLEHGMSGEMKHRGHKVMLESALEEGTITQEQYDAIKAEQEEWHTEMEDLKSLSEEERENAFEAHKEEMEAWFESEGIELEFKGNHPRFGGKGPHSPQQESNE